MIARQSVMAGVLLRTRPFHRHHEEETCLRRGDLMVIRTLIAAGDYVDGQKSVS